MVGGSLANRGTNGQRPALQLVWNADEGFTVTPEDAFFLATGCLPEGDGDAARPSCALWRRHLHHSLSALHQGPVSHLFPHGTTDYAQVAAASFADRH